MDKLQFFVLVLHKNVKAIKRTHHVQLRNKNAERSARVTVELSLPHEQQSHCLSTRYQKGKTNLDFTEARDSEWQWNQLGICKSAPRSRQITMPTPHRSV